MKGFSSPVKLGGLRPDSVGNRNGAFASAIRDAYVTKSGVGGYIPDITNFPPVYDSVSGALLDFNIDWPFPQLFNTDTGLFVGVRAGLYWIKYTDADGWEGTLIANVSISWPWTCAPIPKWPVFASGDALVYWDTVTEQWTVYQKGTPGSGPIWSELWYNPVCVCFANGQLIAGGAKGTDTTLSDGMPEGDGTYIDYISETRIVRWSEIGAAKFLMTETEDD